MKYRKAILQGRLANGYEADRGTRVHAVPIDGKKMPWNNTLGWIMVYPALCGAKPGRRSVGWVTEQIRDVDCAKCAIKIKKTGVDMKNTNVLIVEDNEDLLKIMKSFMEMRNIDCTAVTNFAEAKAEIMTGQFDTVITDFEFPGGCGDDVLGFARQHGINTIYLHSGDPSQSKMQNLYTLTANKADLGINKIIFDIQKKSA